MLGGWQVNEVACGKNHTVVAADGGKRLFSWGVGQGGRLGHANERDLQRPALIEGMVRGGV